MTIEEKRNLLKFLIRSQILLAKKFPSLFENATFSASEHVKNLYEDFLMIPELTDQEVREEMILTIGEFEYAYERAKR